MIHEPPSTGRSLWVDWLVCDSCKTRWCIGENRFPAPQILAPEDPTYRERAQQIFAKYREVRGYLPEWVHEVMQRDLERGVWENILRNADMTLTVGVDPGDVVAVKREGGWVHLSIKLGFQTDLVRLSLTATEARRVAEALLQEAPSRESRGRQDG